MPKAPINTRRETGFTLIEVLVAMLILMVGLLGVAATQLLALQQVNNANLRSQVNSHAMEMAELVRVNDGAVPAAVEGLWEASLLRTVPGATTNIAVAGNTATITINWREREYGSSDSAKTFTYTARIDQ
ncbi:type IV pilus assembly protein PilV [Marinobacter daqiaonensis]|uniref:Type IV pilus assembly protein PilV n=1 Tax=Marinobacter daqiaonensis TaxID=650891 RepID=A0A1I6K5G2_9GAMM|nr:type IV pilus modification protein PilV [Marinobacter daqiaonensis]SFR86436.1 type IV pilus assembly protein PilV [Marinobacter daqiaonensis]